MAAACAWERNVRLVVMVDQLVLVPGWTLESSEVMRGREQVAGKRRCSLQAASCPSCEGKDYSNLVG